MVSIQQAQLTSVNWVALTNPVPTCWAGDVLTGSVKVAGNVQAGGNAEVSNDSSSHLHIALQGRIRTAIGKVRHNPLLFDIEHLLINPVADIYEIVRATPKDSATVPDHEFGFSVRVPNECESGRCMHFIDDSSSEQHLLLHDQMPPSTASKSEPGNKDEAADLISITYCVHITLWENGHIKVHETLPILIQPKLQLLSFPKSEQSGSEIYVEKNFRDLGSLRLAVTCPDKSYLPWPPKAESTSIVLWVKLSFIPDHPVWGLPPMSEVSTKLIAKTAFQKAEATEGKKWTKSQVLSRTTFAVGNVSWDEIALPLSGGFEYVLQAPVPIQFPTGGNMLTSFKSCIAGREFAAHIGFSFGLRVGRDVDVMVPISIEPCIEVTAAW
ncbi:hypothetical protein PENANT_c029G09322 [Penicillium antarcticum]|uniref:Arrestin-like N-terminal domain-containing protein n=1 Tax=Penicillium antarcticum TaxID=416450 RepID=A0A1V6PVS7_9EURO|nr:hypothetical protein PENANT_c029G09322 [Penicillium antarcticum]